MECCCYEIHKLNYIEIGLNFQFCKLRQCYVTYILSRKKWVILFFSFSTIENTVNCHFIRIADSDLQVWYKEKLSLFFFCSTFVLRFNKGCHGMTSAFPDGPSCQEEGVRTGWGIFRDELRGGALSQFTQRECTSLVFKLFTFNAPH